MQTDISPGRVFWITGYSGAGKSTLAHALQIRMRTAGLAPLLLDGDVLRSIFGGRHGYTEQDRRELATAYGHLCAELAAQGADVICATISMFDAVRQWNRQHIAGYREIYLRVPLEVRCERDPKGLYRNRSGCLETPMIGMDTPAEEPASPDLVIDNHGAQTPEASVDLIWKAFFGTQS